MLDDGGVVWKGRHRYPSFDAALEEADAGVSILTLYRLKPLLDLNG